MDFDSWFLIHIRNQSLCWTQQSGKNPNMYYYQWCYNWFQLVCTSIIGQLKSSKCCQTFKHIFSGWKCTYCMLCQWMNIIITMITMYLKNTFLSIIFTMWDSWCDHVFKGQGDMFCNLTISILPVCINSTWLLRHDTECIVQVDQIKAFVVMVLSLTLQAV